MVNIIEINDDDFHEVFDVISVQCHVATTPSGHRILKSSHICELISTVDTLKGEQIRRHQIFNANDILILSDTKHVSEIVRFGEWTNITYNFRPPVYCKIRMRGIVCKTKKEPRDEPLRL